MGSLIAQHLPTKLLIIIIIIIFFFLNYPRYSVPAGFIKLGVRKNVCFIDPRRLAKNCQMSRRTRWHCISEQWQRCVETEKPSLLVRPKMPTSGGPNKLKISPPLRWLDPRSQSRPDKTNTCVWAPGTCHSSILRLSLMQPRPPSLSQPNASGLAYRAR